MSATDLSHDDDDDDDDDYDDDDLTYLSPHTAAILISDRDCCGKVKLEKTSFVWVNSALKHIFRKKMIMDSVTEKGAVSTYGNICVFFFKLECFL